MLQNKNIVVTGANRGIGRAIVIECAKNKANLWACVRNTGRKYRRDDQAGSRDGTTRILGSGKFRSVVITQTGRKPDTSKQDVTASLKKVPSHVVNTDKYYGLI